MRQEEIHDWTEASIQHGEFQPCPACGKAVTDFDVRTESFEYGEAAMFWPCGHGWYQRENDSRAGIWYRYIGV